MSDMKTSAQEIPEEEEVEEEVLEVPIHYLPIIDDQYKGMEEFESLARETHCFGHLWQDHAGVCPSQYDCVIADHCKTVYERVQNSEFGRLGKKPKKKHKKEPHLTGAEHYLALMGEVELEAQRTHHRWEGTNKYTRHGYHDLGRPVDISVRRLVHELGYPPLLEKNWSRKAFDKKYGHLGRIVMSQTTSYHLILVESDIVCRVWTNAAGFALTDISSLLLAKAEMENKETIQVRPKSFFKIRPCAGRIYIQDEEDAAKLASWIISIYKLEVDPVQGAVEGRHIADEPESKLKKQPKKKRK